MHCHIALRQPDWKPDCARFCLCCIPLEWRKKTDQEQPGFVILKRTFFCLRKFGPPGPKKAGKKNGQNFRVLRAVSKLKKHGDSESDLRIKIGPVAQKLPTSTLCKCAYGYRRILTRFGTNVIKMI